MIRIITTRFGKVQWNENTLDDALLNAEGLSAELKAIADNTRRDMGKAGFEEGIIYKAFLKS